jgi:SPP1 family predicted phage head-tail adaptor
LAKCPPSLRHRVVVQTKTETPDGQGGFTAAWTDGASIWVSIEPANGYERYQAMQMQTPITHKITARYNASINTACRLKFGDRILWVVEVLNVEERNRYLKIKAIERA